MTVSLLLGCLKVFLCRICDVSLGSFRTVLIVKGKTVIASIVGFFEVFIWFLIVKDALNTEGPVALIAASYALGYACGTFVGGTLAKRLINNHVTVHVVTSHRDEELCKLLRNAGYGLTVMDVNGSPYGDEKNLILADFELPRLSEFEALVKATDPDSFILIQETKSYVGGYRRPGK